MRIAYFTNQTALQSEPVWRNFLVSCQKLGITPIENSWNADCALIWSVLWRGRMADNRKVYEFYRNQGKPVFIIEVGSLKRGVTWKVAVNNINKFGVYANDDDFLPDRAKKLGLNLGNIKNDLNLPILLAGQHDMSLQWTNPIPIRLWIDEQIKKIRYFTDRPIVVRPHPRNRFERIDGKNIIFQDPIKIPNSYDVYDLKFNYNVVVNFNSGVSIQAAQYGTPVICDPSSLASDVSIPYTSLEQPFLPDRELWFKKIVHTEWTLEEIGEGIPLNRLLSKVDLT